MFLLLFLMQVTTSAIAGFGERSARIMSKCDHTVTPGFVMEPSECWAIHKKCTRSGRCKTKECERTAEQCRRLKPGDGKRAAEQLFRAYAAHKKAKSDLMKKGDKAYRRGAYIAAYRIYRDVCNAAGGELVLACSKQAEMLREHKGIPPEELDRYRKKCDANNMFYCKSLADFYKKGVAVPQDYKRAAAFYRKACDLSDMPACSDLGEMYAEGKGVTQDYKLSATLFRKTCDYGLPGSCMKLAGFHEKGLGVTKDPKLAIAMLRKACDIGHPTACGMAALTYLGITESGIAKDYKLGLKLLGQACDIGRVHREGGSALSCAVLARIHLEGRFGVTASETVARKYASKACKLATKYSKTLGSNIRKMTDWACALSK